MYTAAEGEESGESAIELKDLATLDNLPTRNMRLRVNGKKCTVRWEGCLNAEKDGQLRWFGVEWDSATDGKHSGTFEGKQIFIGKNAGPTSCSFVKKRSVKEIDLFAALLEKYGEKVLSSREIVSVAGTDVSVCRISGREWNFSSVLHLDLSDTLLSDVGQLFGALGAFPRLRIVQLNKMLLEVNNWNSTLENVKFESVETLSLVDVQIEAHDLAVLLKAFPNVRTLNVSGVQCFESAMVTSKVHSLIAERCGLCGVLELDVDCVKFELLNLSSNRLEGIRLAGKCANSTVQRLYLWDNLIEDAKGIEVKSVHSLWLKGNPVACKESFIDVPGLVLLEGSPVELKVSTSKELDCEFGLPTTKVTVNGMHLVLPFRLTIDRLRLWLWRGCKHNVQLRSVKIAVDGEPVEYGDCDRNKVLEDGAKIDWTIE